MPQVQKSAIFLAAALMGFSLAGCGVGASPTSAARAPTSSPRTRSVPPVVGWTYLNVDAQTGGHTVIVKLRADRGGLDLIVSRGITTKAGAETFEPLLLRYNATTGSLSRPVASPYAVPPTLAFASPATSVTLSFPIFGKPPIFISTGSQSEIAPFPPGVPAYDSGINPATDPGTLDNVVIGTSGSWVWVALKGPAKAPAAGLVWQFRHWNRILAFNLRTHQYFVYPIPRSSSLAAVNPGWWQAPAFVAANHRVFIAVGSWLGVFPSMPTAHRLAVLKGPPAALIAKRTSRMMAALSNLYWQASDGLAAYWNCSVMQDPNSQACPGGASGVPYRSWVLNPAVFNHGDYPETLIWAASFPLVPGSALAAKRNRMLSTILRLARSPLTTAQIVYPTAAAAQAGFHDTPPTALPGFAIRGEYYWAVASGP